MKIKKPSKKAVKTVPSKISTTSQKGFDPEKYFGKLVRGLDGMTYQKVVRSGVSH